MRPFLKMPATPAELRARGILGINRRNADFVLPVNPRSHYPRVDDKLLTKTFCEARGIPVPTTYAIIERQGDIRGFPDCVRDQQQFVIKPASGSGGRGIIVVAKHDGETFHTSGGETLELPDVRYHLSTVISGLYSLAGQHDRAIIEQRIIRHTVFERVAVGGTPDVRIILYRGVPVMAMVRLPTRASRGRANLHQGAVAASVDLRTCETYGGVCKDRIITEHPDTGASINGLRVPFWDKLLEAAQHLAEALEMGYIGVDFVLDAHVGPVILEANARPGLAIQVANRCGLQHRLDFLDAQPPEVFAPARRAELVKTLSGMS